MLLRICHVLDDRTLHEVTDVLDKLAFIDGRATAGWSARHVKSNRQPAPGAALDGLRARVTAAIVAHPVFALGVRPRTLSPLIFARYGVGDGYGAHVDDALMGGLRTDVAFTLFLSRPEDYDGGELVIDSSAGEDAIKLDAGSLVAYPATTLHRVEPVTRGERQVAVGWARSFIRSAEQRELLFDLDTARRTLFELHGPSGQFNLLSKCSANLIRMWADD